MRGHWTEKSAKKSKLEFHGKVPSGYASDKSGTVCSTSGVTCGGTKMKRVGRTTIFTPHHHVSFSCFSTPFHFFFFTSKMMMHSYRFFFTSRMLHIVHLRCKKEAVWPLVYCTPPRFLFFVRCAKSIMVGDGTTFDSLQIRCMTDDPCSKTKKRKNAFFIQIS